MRAAILTAALVLLPLSARADRVILKEGQAVEGRVLSEGKEVVLQIDGGKVSFPAADVAKVEKDNQSALSTLEQKRAALGDADVKGRLDLARYASKQGLHAEARSLYREVIELDPNQAEARAALGHKKHQGQWLDDDAYHAAIGDERYAGRWMSKEDAAAERAEDEARAARHAAPKPKAKPEASSATGEPAPSGERSDRPDECWGNNQWLGGAPVTQGWWGYQGFRGLAPGGMASHQHTNTSIGAGIQIQIGAPITRGAIPSRSAAPAAPPSSSSRGGSGPKPNH